MADGKGCKCFARAEGECGCGVDWRSAREVELEAEVERLKVDLSKPPKEREYCSGCSLLQDKEGANKPKCHVCGGTREFEGFCLDCVKESE